MSLKIVNAKIDTVVTSWTVVSIYYYLILHELLFVLFVCNVISEGFGILLVLLLNV